MLAEVVAPMPLWVAGESAYDGAGALPALGEAQLLGVLTDAEVLALFRASAVYLCTSRYEPFGLGSAGGGVLRLCRGGA